MRTRAIGKCFIDGKMKWCLRRPGTKGRWGGFTETKIRFLGIVATQKQTCLNMASKVQGEWKLGPFEEIWKGDQWICSFLESENQKEHILRKDNPIGGSAYSRNSTCQKPIQERTKTITTEIRKRGWTSVPRRSSGRWSGIYQTYGAPTVFACITLKTDSAYLG